MRRKQRKIAITILLAFGLFINCSSNIHGDVNNSSILQGTLPYSDPIIGDH